MTSAGTVKIETDVDLATMPIGDVAIVELVALARPDIKMADVVSVQVGTVGVEASRQDGGGMTIFLLIDA